MGGAVKNKIKLDVFCFINYTAPTPNENGMNRVEAKINRFVSSNILY